MFFSTDAEEIKAEMQLRLLVAVFEISETSGYVLYGPESFAEVLGPYEARETKGLAITRIRPNVWEVTQPSDGLREVLDPVRFMGKWLGESCKGDQRVAWAMIDNLGCELDRSENPEDGRQREALRYLVSSAGEAGIIEKKE